MSKIIIPHGEITSIVLHSTGDFLRQNGIPQLVTPRSVEAFTYFAVEYIDGVLRDMSHWLPSPKTEPGLLNLIRLIPEIKVVCDLDLMSDYTCDVLEPYRQRIHDALVSTNIDWNWAEYRILQFDAKKIVIDYLGDIRIREWNRTNKNKEVAYARANYAASRKTICYPNGVLRD